MALHENVWFPDTCSCVITYQWDDVGTGSATIASVNKVGGEHGTLTGTALYQVLTSENGRKNQMMSVASSFISSLNPQNIAWSYNISRVLLVSFPGTSLSNAVKTNIQNAADLQFGSGKVAVS